MPAASRAARSPGTSGSAATTPTEPSRVSACRTASTTVSGTAPGAHARSVSSPSPRSERAGGTSTPSRSRSRLVRPTTFFGTRNPVVSGTTAASGRPRWARTVRQDRAAHGVVPWARSPRTVSEPKAERRAMARHSIGERSWASSTTMWPQPSGCSRSPATSSSRTRSAADQRADFHDRGARPVHSRARCSSSSSTPSAALASSPGSPSSGARTSSGRTRGHTASRAAPTGRARSTRRSQALVRGPARRSARSWRYRTIRALTRSRPTVYGGCSRRTSATMRASASAGTRQR
ncbi:hypothetical protein BZZ08_06122 [Streptomyces sp. MH60]|nr:hypothetical protein BZZ08_06122 [Streptomyces sp. MH60]